MPGHARSHARLGRRDALASSGVKSRRSPPRSATTSPPPSRAAPAGPAPAWATPAGPPRQSSSSVLWRRLCDLCSAAATQRQATSTLPCRCVPISLRSPGKRRKGGCGWADLAQSSGVERGPRPRERDYNPSHEAGAAWARARIACGCLNLARTLCWIAPSSFILAWAPLRCSTVCEAITENENVLWPVT